MRIFRTICANLISDADGLFCSYIFFFVVVICGWEVYCLCASFDIIYMHFCPFIAMIFFI